VGGIGVDGRPTAFHVVSTEEQDERFIAIFNDRRNKGTSTCSSNNCADFSRVVLDIYLPHAIHRSIVADLGMTTPKQVAKSLAKYGHKHPELEMSAFVIPQVPGSVGAEPSGRRRGRVSDQEQEVPAADGDPESGGRPGSVVVAYLAKGRMKLPKDAAVFNVDDQGGGTCRGCAGPAREFRRRGDGSDSGSPSLQ